VCVFVCEKGKRKRGCGFSRMFVFSEVCVNVFVCACMGLRCMCVNVSICSRVGVRVPVSTVYVCACAMCV